MKYNRIVGRVGVVMVTQPVGGLHMNLHIAGPGLAVDYHGGIEKVGPGVGVELALIHHSHTAPVDSGHPRPEGKPVLPHKLQELFHWRAVKEFMTVGCLKVTIKLLKHIACSHIKK